MILCENRMPPIAAYYLIKLMLGNWIGDNDEFYRENSWNHVGDSFLQNRSRLSSNRVRRNSSSEP